MKITCQSCQSKYNVADEKVQGKIVKIRCRKCGATIVVNGTGGAAANGTAANGTGTGAARALRVRAGGPVPPGGALLMIRPTGVALCDARSGEHHLVGTVADVAFRGRGYEHAVDVPGHGRLTGVFAPVRAARGERVGVRLDVAGCHVFAQASGGENGQSPAS